MHPGVYIRGSVRIRERWVCIHRGCVYAPPRVYTGFCVYAPPTARDTQESTEPLNVRSDPAEALLFPLCPNREH